MRSVKRLPASHESGSSTTSLDLRRRGFLLAVGAGAVGAAATPAALAQQSASAAPAGSSATRGYRETEHVRDYYRTTRI
jgi:hypothetical protein